MKGKKTYPVVDTPERLTEAIASVRAAQREYASYTQEQVDKIFLAAATAANRARIPLAKMAVEETGMGVMEDKVIKNHFAAEYIYNKYRHEKTCGVIERDDAYRRHSGGHTDNEPDLDGDIQVAARAQDPQRYNLQPASPRPQVHHRRGEGRA